MELIMVIDGNANPGLSSEKLFKNQITGLTH
jgi:hypothetical protein